MKKSILQEMAEEDRLREENKELKEAFKIAEAKYAELQRKLRDAERR